MTDGARILTIPRHNPVNAYTMGGIVRDAGLTVDQSPMVEGVQVNARGWAHYAPADDGTLVYLPSVGGAGAGSTELVWVDRVTGEETPISAPARGYVQPRISPDGTRVAVDLMDEGGSIWVWDLTGEAPDFDERRQGASLGPRRERVVLRGRRPAARGAGADGPDLLTRDSDSGDRR